MTLFWLPLRGLLVFGFTLVPLFVFLAKPALSLEETTLETPETEAALRLFMAGAKTGTMQVEERVQISHIHVKPQARDRIAPVLVIFPGYSESWRKYDELVYDLTHSGFEVFVMDHRGMGDSTHLVQGTKYSLAHVEAFQDYVNDARQWLEQVVLPQAPQGIHVLGHSLGGLIALATTAQLDLSKAKILSIGLNAPLLSLNTGGIPLWITAWVLKLQIAILGSQSPVIGRKLYDPMTADPQQCRVTHSARRCGRGISLLRRHPALVVESPTVQWAYQILKTTTRPDFHKNLAQKLRTIPVLLLQAGVDDYVLPEGQEVFCRSHPRCSLELVPEGYHELLHEKDSIREGVLKKLVNFYQKSGG